MSHIRAAKHLGQHFLHERGIIDRIITAINPQAGEHIVEIGPGTGVLTRGLLQAGAHVTAIEIDDRCWPVLEEMGAQFGNRLTIHKGDALKAFGTAVPVAGRKVVGNLPYNVGTEMVAQLVQMRPITAEMTFMLQKEVVERICAVPDTRDWGRLGVLCDLYCDRQDLFDVAPGAFTPPPKVMSSVVRLHPLPRPRESVDTKKLDTLLRLVFTQRRKMLRSVLKGHVTEDTMLALGITPTDRAEVLSTAQFCALATALKP